MQQQRVVLIQQRLDKPVGLKDPVVHAVGALDRDLAEGWEIAASSHTGPVARGDDEEIGVVTMLFVLARNAG